MTERKNLIAIAFWLTLLFIVYNLFPKHKTTIILPPQQQQVTEQKSEPKLKFKHYKNGCFDAQYYRDNSWILRCG